MSNMKRRQQKEEAGASAGFWSFLGSGVAFFKEVLSTLKKHPVLAILWGICVLFLFFVVATFVLGGDLPPWGKLGLVVLALLVISILFIFTVAKTESPNSLARHERHDQSAQSPILTATTDALNALHELDNAIRQVVGPVSRFDYTWSDDKRKEAIERMGVLADTQVILPRVRQSIAELKKVREIVGNGSDEAKAVDAVVACGAATLESLGQSEVTPWPGPHELASLIFAVRTADSPEKAEAVMHMAQNVLTIVDRKRLADADFALGQLRGSRRKGGTAHC